MLGFDRWRRAKARGTTRLTVGEPHCIRWFIVRRAMLFPIFSLMAIRAIPSTATERCSFKNVLLGSSFFSSSPSFYSSPSFASSSASFSSSVFFFGISSTQCYNIF